MNEKKTIKMIKNGSILDASEIPETDRTEEVYSALLFQEFGRNVDSIPADILTKDFLSKVISTHSKAKSIFYEFYNGQNKPLLQYVPKKLITRELIEIAIKSEAENICFVPMDILNDEFYEEMLDLNGRVLNFIPKTLITPENCQRAFDQDVRALYSFPKKYITEYHCEIYIKKSHAIGAIPEDMLNPKILALGVASKPHRQDRTYFNSLPEDLISEDLLLELLTFHSSYLRRFSDKFERLGMLADDKLFEIINVNYRCLAEIPKELLTREICLHALTIQASEINMPLKENYDIPIIKYFPKKDIDEIVAKKAIELNAENFSYIPKKFQTSDLLEILLGNSKYISDIIEYIPLHLLSEDICLRLLKEPRGHLGMIPDKAKTKKICMEAVMESANSSVFVPENIYFPELLICCKKQRYPSVKVLDALLNDWVSDESVSKQKFLAILDNAPEKTKKTSTWKNWELRFSKS